MSQVPAKPGAASVPTVPSMPSFSPYLGAVIRHAASGDSAYPVLIPAHFQASLSKEAERAIPGMKERMRPADFNKWAWFLQPLKATVRNPPTQAGFEGFVANTAAALINVPAYVLVPWRQREAVRKFTFWPSAADLADWLAPEGREDRIVLGALEKLAAKPEADEEQHEATQEAFAAVRAKAAAFKAEVVAQEKAQREAERVRPVARYLTDDQLRAALAVEIRAGGTRAIMADLQLKALEARK